MKPKPMLRKAMPLVLGGLTFSGLAQGQVSLTTADGTNGADASLQNDGNRSPNHNSGGESIHTRYFPGTRMKVGIIRFDIRSLSPTSDNSGATLSFEQVFGGTRNRPWRVYGLRDGFTESVYNPTTMADVTADEFWVEGSITYNTAPGILDSDADPLNGKGLTNGADILTTLNIYDATTNPTGAWEFIGDVSDGAGGGYPLPGVGGGPLAMPLIDLGPFIDADTNGYVTFLVFATGADNTFDLASKESGATSASYPTLILPNGTASDDDGDGLPNDWEIANGLDPNDDGTTDPNNGANGDPDSDGVFNIDEYNAVPSSDPQDILSVPGDVDGDGLADLWEDANFGDNSGTVELGELVLQDGEGDPDRDDGTNEQEETAMTDPNDRASFLDDDGGSPDGQNDWWEIRYFGDTTTSTAGTDDIDSDTHDNATEYAAFANPNDPSSVPGDIDGDTLNDLWEDQYFGNNDGIVLDDDLIVTNDAAGDPDADGATNKEESDSMPVASNPNDPNSVPGNADGDTLADDWELDFFADIYGQKGTNDNDNDLYTNEEEETAGTDPTDNYDFPEDTDDDEVNDRWELKWFGTLLVSEGGTDDWGDDNDSDTWLNDEEYDGLSNPNNAMSTPDDVDGDGLLDTDEIAFWGDIYAYDGDDDPDRDYSTNLEEVDALSDPNSRASSPDTDGDLLGDGWERFSFGSISPTEGGTDDPDGDPDVDGHTNAAEYAAATNGNDALSTPDTDGDRLPDGWEAFYFAMEGEDPVADVATIIARQNGTDDSDAGGASNLLEYYLGTNPNETGDDPTPTELSTAVGNGADIDLANDQQNAGTGPTVMNGLGNGMAARYLEGVRIHIPMIRFDVSGLSGDLTDTMLRLNTTFGSPAATGDLLVYGLVDGSPGEDWDEATTSYSTAPGIIFGEELTLNTWSRDRQAMRLIGRINVNPNGINLSDPALLDLKTFIENDSDGLVTIALQTQLSPSRWYGLSTKESGLELAPTLVVPNGTLTVPANLTITSVSLDGGTFTMSAAGLTVGQQYHVENSTDGTFAAVPGSTFTAASDPEDVEVTVDTMVAPTQLFRISDGAEPAAP